MRVRRTCKCGCPRSMDAKRSDALWATEGCRKAFHRGTAPASPDKARTRKPSGLQVSFPKAVRTLAAALKELDVATDGKPLITDDEYAKAANGILNPALSDRQRQQLEARHAT